MLVFTFFLFVMIGFIEEPALMEGLQNSVNAQRVTLNRVRAEVTRR